MSIPTPTGSSFQIGEGELIGLAAEYMTKKMNRYVDPQTLAGQAINSKGQVFPSLTFRVIGNASWTGGGFPPNMPVQQETLTKTEG